MAGLSRYDAFKEEAEKWCRENSTARWQLFLADETDRQLVFTHDNGEMSFSVICPSDNKVSNVSLISNSSNDDVMRIVRNIHGINNIQEYLGKVTAALEPLVNTHISREDEGDDDSETDMNDDDYYNNMDEDESPHVRKAVADSVYDEDSDLTKYSGAGSQTSVRRLIVDLKMFRQSDGKFGIRGSPRNDNLFLWDVQLTDFDAGSPLTRDLNRFAAQNKERPELHLEVIFPDDYPMSPPFIRVVKPRFEFLTGHVTVGGSICMELLTKSGWRPTNDIESILVQVRSAIMSDPNARLHRSQANVPYTMKEAKTAFQRMVERYKWDK
ncbi:ubiquitin-conjugating enzyme E2 Q1-like isoform X2 [Asterias rubens]|uniref:ubiquitin-conjugating enzyme E2 Q1-like isoform X2 n=1 Tax=Asterias rubens TaxID=7604 RepID=UPI0014552005|nr:ubiquitin-conjugating enzyme E2 Q1-like isoform X2 [Asterias rubens]